MGRLRVIVLGVALVAAGSAGGHALTESNTLPASTKAGYGSVTVTGSTISSVVYGFNGDGSTITQAVLKVTGDITSGYEVSAAFGTDNLTACTIGAYSNPSTTVTCTFSPEITTATATAFHVAVRNNP